MRRENGFDRDLGGNRRAIGRRARQLQQGWLHGNPVARWTAEPEVYGAPLYPREQAEMEYRERYCSQFINVVEHWVEGHAESTYAGYDFNDKEGVIYLGFTADPTGTLEAFKHDIRLIAPDRIQPFPVPPVYTLRELNHLWRTYWKGALLHLVNVSHVDVLANKVEVGTEHVAKVRRILAERYGPEAPFKVVFATPVLPS